MLIIRGYTLTYTIQLFRLIRAVPIFLASLKSSRTVIISVESFTTRQTCLPQELLRLVIQFQK